MTEAIAAKKHPPIASLPSTRRRAQIADSLYQEGLRLEQIQSWLYAIADRAEQGNLPSILEGISAKTQLEVLASMSKDSWGDKDIEKVFASDGWYKDWVKKLKSAGICTPQQCRKAIATLKELGAEHPSSNEEAEALEISQLKREAVWQEIPDYFPTPQHLLERMIQLARLEPGMRVLEPSAGSGSICLEVRAAGIEPDCFEVSPTLREILTRQGFNLIGDDFMEATPKPIYHRVIMNPPFSLGNDIHHVQQAFKWLVPGGRLVSIVSCSYTFGAKQKYQHFRSWLRSLGATEFDNPAGSFLQSDRRTNANTRMLALDKPIHDKANL
jgi:predicted RNA methylase